MGYQVLLIFVGVNFVIARESLVAGRISWVLTARVAAGEAPRVVNYMVLTCAKESSEPYCRKLHEQTNSHPVVTVDVGSTALMAAGVGWGRLH